MHCSSHVVRWLGISFMALERPAGACIDVSAVQSWVWDFFRILGLRLVLGLGFWSLGFRV